jgi:hypothetical protein
MQYLEQQLSVLLKGLAGLLRKVCCRCPPRIWNNDDEHTGKAVTGQLVLGAIIAEITVLYRESSPRGHSQEEDPRWPFRGRRYSSHSATKYILTWLQSDV